ncbi:MAG: DUF2500 family protein [Clostridiales bacterium]|nr:DUF2500 family protein [Clostridiales bacterium]
MSSKMKSFLFGLGAVAVMVALFFICFAVMKNQEKKFDKDRIPYEQERDAAIEEARKLDPEENKIVLTNRYLKSEYRLFYESRKFGGGTFTMIVSIMLGAVSLYCIASIIVMIIQSKRRGEPINFFRVIWFIVGLLSIIVVFFLIRSFTSRSSSLNPENAGYKIYTINVLRKKSETTTSTDSNGHTTESTKYYIFYEGANNSEVKLSVVSSLYDAVSDPGFYYLVSACEGDDFVYFGIYSTDTYKKA